MLARGSLGNPWLFEQLLGARDARADARGGPRRARLGDGPRRRAPRRRARGALPAQVLPLVRRRGSAAARRCRTRSSATASLAEARARSLRWSARARLRRPQRRSRRYTARPPSRRRSPRSSGLSCDGVDQHEATMPKDVILTPEGLEKLKDELEHLQTTAGARSPSASRRRASSATSPRTPSTTTPRTSRRCSRRGSPSSRSSCAPRRSSTPRTSRTDVVGVGSIVHVKDQKTGKSQKYTIVGSAEANPAERKLSNESPVGKALIGHKRNDDRRGRRCPTARRASSRSPRSTSGCRLDGGPTAPS